MRHRLLSVLAIGTASAVLVGCPSGWHEMSKPEQDAYTASVLKGLAHYYASQCGQPDPTCAKWHGSGTNCSMTTVCDLDCAMDHTKCAPCGACAGLACMEGKAENPRVKVSAVKVANDYSPQALVTDAWTVELKADAKLQGTNCHGIKQNPGQVIKAGTMLSITVPVQRFVDPLSGEIIFARICKIEWETGFTPQVAGNVYAEHFASNWKSFEVKDPLATEPPFEIVKINEGEGACVGWLECKL